MPFKSKAQQRYMYAAAARGEIPKKVVKKFSDATDFKKLPEHVKTASPVFIYRNIRKGKDNYVYSIKNKEGRVQGHVSDLLLDSPELKVSQKGKDRVRAEKAKNVHAGIRGNIKPLNEGLYNWRGITYDPYKYDNFVFRDTGEVVDAPDAIKLTPKGALAGFIKEGFVKKFEKKIKEKKLAVQPDDSLKAFELEGQKVDNEALAGKSN